MKEELPQIIQDVGFDFDWDEKKVWKLDLPVVEMPIEDLAWHFDIPFWWEDGGFYNLKPRSVLEDQDKYKDRIERIMQADITYPLDIMYWKNRWVLLDGLHRLTKHFLLGNDTVEVRKVPEERIQKILKD